MLVIVTVKADAIDSLTGQTYLGNLGQETNYSCNSSGFELFWHNYYKFQNAENIDFN